MINDVFALNKTSFVLISVLNWVLTVPIGVMCFMLMIIDPNYYGLLYYMYAFVKFIILALNLLIFCRLFWEVIKKNTESDANKKSMLKTCAVSFVLLCVLGVQAFLQLVLLLGLVSYFTVYAEQIVFVYLIMNSFQVVAITTIFVILTKASCDDSLWKTVINRCQRMRA